MVARRPGFTWLREFARGAAEICMAMFSCECGRVVYETAGAPMTSVICYCDDCQEAARQLEHSQLATAVQDADGGTAYLVYRKDRVTCRQGASLLQYHKIRKESATTRVIAICCHSAMLLMFDDSKHWVDVYRSRCKKEGMPVQMRICTTFRLNETALPTDVPCHSRYPLSLLLKLIHAKIAMLLHR